ncbi:hypothetical protein LCGC14_1042250, partial [marine sediment metagenome]
MGQGKGMAQLVRHDARVQPLRDHRRSARARALVVGIAGAAAREADAEMDEDDVYPRATVVTQLAEDVAPDVVLVLRRRLLALDDLDGADLERRAHLLFVPSLNVHHDEIGGVVVRLLVAGVEVY